MAKPIVRLALGELAESLIAIAVVSQRNARLIATAVDAGSNEIVPQAAASAFATFHVPAETGEMTDSTPSGSGTNWTIQIATSTSGKSIAAVERHTSPIHITVISVIADSSASRAQTSLEPKGSGARSIVAHTIAAIKVRAPWDEAGPRKPMSVVRCEVMIVGCR